MNDRLRGRVQVGVLTVLVLGLSAFALIALEQSTARHVGAMSLSDVLVESSLATQQTETTTDVPTVAADESDSTTVLLNDWSYTRRTRRPSQTWSRPPQSW